MASLPTIFRTYNARMHHLPPYRRLLVLTDGQLGIFTSKTAAALLRYRAHDVVAIVDPRAAGRDVRTILPAAPPVPIVATVADAAPLRPDALMIGVAPPGGRLSASLRVAVRSALDHGIDVVSGLHTFLADDDELHHLAAARDARIFDVRRPPTDPALGTGQSRHTPARRVLTVGTDGNVGKMVTALELTRAACARGIDARFLATGQTGIMISGSGIAIDACVIDFASGAAESLVQSAFDAELLFVEGQGSLGHPGFSAVTLALLHGVAPDALVLVHRTGRTHYRAQPDEPLPPMNQLIEAYETAAALCHPARVVGLALNSIEVKEGDYVDECDALAKAHGLGVSDPVRDGADRLLDVVQQALDYDTP